MAIARQRNGPVTATWCRPSSSGGIHNEPNMKNTLKRKYLMQAIDGSLGALRSRFSSTAVLPPGRPDHTSSRRTVWANVGHQSAPGKALYWGNIGMDGRRDQGPPGTSPERQPPAQAGDGTAAIQHLWAGRVRVSNTTRLYRDIGLGLTTWSPLASGLLSGKYLDGVPEGSRGALPGLTSGCRERSPIPDRNDKVRNLKKVADDLGCTPGQLASPGARQNPRVSHRDHRSQPTRAGGENMKGPGHRSPARAAGVNGPHRRNHPLSIGAARVSSSSERLQELGPQSVDLGGDTEDVGQRLEGAVDLVPPDTKPAMDAGSAERITGRVALQRSRRSPGSGSFRFSSIRSNGLIAEGRSHPR